MASPMRQAGPNKIRHIVAIEQRGFGIIFTLQAGWGDDFEHSNTLQRLAS